MSKGYYKKNKDKWKRYYATRRTKEEYRSSSLAAAKRWQSRNPEKTVRSRSLSWQKNKAKNLARMRRYRAANPERFSHSYTKRATPSWANEFFISEAFHLARLRTKMLGFKWSVDHIIPLRSKLVCGLHVENNLSVIPTRENQSKNNRHWPDMP